MLFSRNPPRIILTEEKDSGESVFKLPTSKTTVPANWKQGLAVTRQVLTRFEIGDRDAHINPKYARVGWNSFWQNDEWWAEKAVARR